eukprot:TRINITY_DN42903_c0_g1_i1.p1 TRINITY_DN42903_c0_g1~~TRINITY_DN42903_c0_g1_i1.p1  ORF type:complete len:127 (+),score=36.78 TRINITY_DN42903_c0_g1_i1:148-528(+)
MCIRDRDMARVARDVQNQIQLVGAKHKEAVAKARADHEAAIKRIGRKIDAELDDELATKQRALEASTRAAITALQDEAVSYTHLRAHETPEHLVCRLLLEKKNSKTKNIKKSVWNDINVYKKNLKY